MTGSLSRRLILATLSLASLFSFTSCSTTAPIDDGNQMIVSVRDQRMLLVRDGVPVKSYPVSTSKFGIGDKPGSNHTPLGRMKVAVKIGDDAPLGAVFKSRRPTGEVLPPNSPGRDPIVTRILWLKGTEAHNRNAFRRYIYIHGTPEASRLGSPASFGCIRMSCKDIADLYRRVGTGAEVIVTRSSLSETPEGKAYAARSGNFWRQSFSTQRNNSLTPPA
jgi:lipoprotein-anchoring transpeptidase ErfK/SrfK